jgi:hypothetical protein
MFNDYREAYGLGRMTSFEELTADTEVQDRLSSGTWGSSPRTTPTT